MDNKPDIIFIEPANSFEFGQAFSCIGDVNQDGYDDILISSLNDSSWSGIVYLYYGGSPMDTIADKIFIGDHRAEYFGKTIINTGDINGDAFNNFIITSDHGLYIYMV